MDATRNGFDSRPRLDTAQSGPPQLSVVSFVSGFSQSCSWCHELNDLSQPGPIFCECGHRADLPRADCTCPSCERDRRLTYEDHATSDL
jgi:hypothetical protein